MGQDTDWIAFSVILGLTKLHGDKLPMPISKSKKIVDDFNGLPASGLPAFRPIAFYPAL
jgi:hypothetical protein